MLYVFAIVIGLFLLLLIAWQVHQLITGYAAATGTPWQRFLAVFSHSATILTARITTAFGAITAFVAGLLPSIDPSTSLGQSVVALFNPDTAKYWLAGIGVLGLIFETVRRRAGSVDPILPPPQAVVTK